VILLFGRACARGHSRIELSYCLFRTHPLSQSNESPHPWREVTASHGLQIQL
jgi:hypothetical protein